VRSVRRLTPPTIQPLVLPLPVQSYAQQSL
jgi:hypothetical protein